MCLFLGHSAFDSIRLFHVMDNCKHNFTTMLMWSLNTTNFPTPLLSIAYLRAWTYQYVPLAFCDLALDSHLEGKSIFIISKDKYSLHEPIKFLAETKNNLQIQYFQRYHRLLPRFAVVNGTQSNILQAAKFSITKNLKGWKNAEIRAYENDLKAAFSSVRVSYDTFVSFKCKRTPLPGADV